MTNQEQTLAEFHTYAREIMATHTENIRKQYRTTELSAELRLRIFNENLSIVKESLLTKMRELSMTYSNQVGGDGRLIATRLNTQYNSYINEFFKSDF